MSNDGSRSHQREEATHERVEEHDTECMFDAVQQNAINIAVVEKKNLYISGLPGINKVQICSMLTELHAQALVNQLQCERL